MGENYPDRWAIVARNNTDHASSWRDMWLDKGPTIKHLLSKYRRNSLENWAVDDSLGCEDYTMNSFEGIQCGEIGMY